MTDSGPGARLLAYVRESADQLVAAGTARRVTTAAGLRLLCVPTDNQADVAAAAGLSLDESDAALRQLQESGHLFTSRGHGRRYKLARGYAYAYRPDVDGTPPAAPTATVSAARPARGSARAQLGGWAAERLPAPWRDCLAGDPVTTCSCGQPVCYTSGHGGTTCRAGHWELSARARELAAQHQADLDHKAVRDAARRAGPDPAQAAAAALTLLDCKNRAQELLAGPLALLAVDRHGLPVQGQSARNAARHRVRLADIGSLIDRASSPAEIAAVLSDPQARAWLDQAARFGAQLETTRLEIREQRELAREQRELEAAARPEPWPDEDEDEEPGAQRRRKVIDGASYSVLARSVAAVTRTADQDHARRELRAGKLCATCTIARATGLYRVIRDGYAPGPDAVRYLCPACAGNPDQYTRITALATITAPAGPPAAFSSGAPSGGLGFGLDVLRAIMRGGK